MIYRKVREVAGTGAIPIILGGDHSITWPAATAIAELRAPKRVGIVHFDAHADTANDDVGRAGQPRRPDAPPHRVGRHRRAGTSSRWGCAATGRRRRRSTGCRSRACAGTSCARSRSAARRRSSPTPSPRRSTGPTSSTSRIDIDVIDPGMAPGTGTPEPGGMLTREVLRAIRQIVGGRGPRGDGHRRGLAALRPGRDDRDGGEPRRARGDQRARRPARGRPPPSAGRAEPSPTRPGRPIARRPTPSPGYYDLDLVDDPGDLDLYLALAERTGGPVLELAAGTGRLAVPLAAGRRPGHGRRPRPGDARRGRDDAPREAGLDGTDRLELVEADLVGLRLPDAGPYGLAFIALNSLLILRVARRPAGRAPDAGRPPRSGRRGGGRHLAARCRGPRPLRRADHPRVAARRTPRPATIVTKAGSAQHDAATGDDRLDDDLRGGGAGRPGPALGPARPAAPGVGRRARVRSPRTRGSSSRCSPATTGSARSVPAASGPSWSRSRRSRSGVVRRGLPGRSPRETPAWYRRPDGIERPDPPARRRGRAAGRPVHPRPAERAGHGQAARRPHGRREGARRRSASCARTSSWSTRCSRAGSRARSSSSQIRQAELGVPVIVLTVPQNPVDVGPRARASTACSRCRSRASTS